MKEMNFSINIAAPVETVWKVLWSDDTYRKWTSVFDPGSHAESDWKEGSKVRFLTADNHGMYALIEKCVPFKQMTFRHLGEIKDGKEQPFDKDKNWSDSYEAYYLDYKNGQTELKAEMSSVPDEYREFFSGVFPKALAIVKELSESGKHNE